MAEKKPRSPRRTLAGGGMSQEPIAGMVGTVLGGGDMPARAARVLVVEDDRDIRASLEEVLTDVGYQVEGAGNGRAALDALRRGAGADLIVLDLMMPVMDGWTFCQETERDPAFAAIPILIVSAVTRLDPRTAHVRSVAQLSKPLNFDDLLAALALHC